MRECALLVLAGCLVTSEGPVVTSSDPIIAIAADDIGVAWADSPPGRAVNLWALERGALQYRLGSVATLDRLALVRHQVYASAGREREVVGADGKFLVVRTGNVIDAFDPGVDAIDHDPWKHAYPATGATHTSVGGGMLGIFGPYTWRTFELGGTSSAVHAVGAQAPTLVRPISDGIAFVSAEGVFTSRHGGIEQLAEPDDWAHLVEMGGVLWAATAASEEPSRFVRIENGVITELDAPGTIIGLTVGAGHVYFATEHAIYRAD